MAEIKKTNPFHTQKYVVGLALFFLGLSGWSVALDDPDLGWHLLGGAYILDHHTVPTFDFINLFNTYWLDYHWLSQMIFEGINRVAGLIGLSFLVGIISALTMIILFTTVSRRSSAHAAVAAFVAVLWSYTLIHSVESIRPQLFSILIVSIAQLVILRKNRLELPILFLCAVLCVQVHVYWVFVPALWFFYRCLPRLYGRDKTSSTYSWSGLALLFVSGLISPYGLVFRPAESPFPFFSQYLLLYDYSLATSDLRDYLNEFKGGFERMGVGPWSLLAWVALTAWQVRSSGKRLLATLPQLTAGLFAAFLAIRTLKFVAVLAVLGLPIFYLGVFHVISVMPKYRSLLTKYFHPATVTLLVAAICYAAINWPGTTSPGVESFQAIPIAACEKIPTLVSPKADGSPVRVLTHFNYGGWCRWAMDHSEPSFNGRVTTDGRTQFVPAALYIQSFDLFLLRFDWAKTLFDWHPDVLLVDKWRALGQYLISNSRFTLAYEDDNFALFVPK